MTLKESKIRFLLRVDVLADMVGVKMTSPLNDV